ncbi:MAG: hypothetical protein P4M07_24330 [Xanthobacteraceae bacterium]|nr:hypothetical protein [Xanthobacteraceae bacterium]
MTVIEHDFGLQEREVARRFTRLLSLDALHEANVRANPLPYLERASEHIYQLERALFDAAQAAAPSGGEPPSAETIMVDKAEYQRLVACRAVVALALAQLGLHEDESRAPANP